MALTAKQGADGKVIFLVEADDSKIDSQLKKTTQKIKSESQNWGSSVKSYLGKEMDSLIAKVANLGAAFGEFVVKFIAQGIELAESVKELDGSIDSVFGEEGSDKINKWSQNVVKQFGLSELAAKKYASKMGLMAKSKGMAPDAVYQLSTGVTGFAADLAAAVPGTTSQAAFDAIYNALQGKSTSLTSKFAIDLSDKAMKGIYSDWSKMESGQQMALRYLQLEKEMERMNYTGNFAGSNGLEQNKQMIQANIENANLQTGKFFAPVWERIVKETADLTNTLMGNGKAVTGTYNQLVQRNSDQQHVLEDQRALLEQIAAEQGAKFGLSAEDDFEAGFGYNTFGEWLYATLQARQQMTGGKEREKIDEALAAMEPYMNNITEAQAAIKDIEEQIKILEADNSAAAESAASSTAQGIANGLNSKVGTIGTAVNNINSELSRLGGGFYNFNTGSFIFSHANGLDYVPYDNYRASLHAGESVLTAQEAKVWRSMKYNLGTGNGLNYDALGSTMRDNVKAGGNVYLDGQAVGRVISARQADAYRAMERSGFQQ